MRNNKENYVENGSRYNAVRNALESQPGVVILSDIKKPRIDEGKYKHYDDTTIVVAPESGNLKSEDMPAFTGGLLTDMEPIFRHEQKDGKLKTFDTLGNNHFRPIVVEVFPSVAAAQENIK